MSKEDKLCLKCKKGANPVAAGVLAVLIASVFMPLAVGQDQQPEPPGAWTGTWVGSYKARWTCSFIDSTGTSTSGEEFTVYLTITVNGWDYTGRQRITYHRFYWTTTDPDTRVIGASISPTEFDVAIHGFISADNRLILQPDQMPTCREARTSLYRTSLPGEPEKWEQETSEYQTELLTPFIDVAVERIGDIMRVCESHSTSESMETLTVTSTYYAEGALVLQKEGRTEIKPTCLAVQGYATVQHTGEAFKEPLDPEMELELGDRITTGTDGKAVILLPDGSQVNLDSSTSVTLKELLETGNLRMTLDLGRLYFRVKSKLDALKPRNKFEIHTPVAVTSPRGTEFTLEVSEDGATTLIVLEGAADFSDLQMSKTVTVVQNQTSTVRPGGVPSDPTTLDLNKIEAWWEEKLVEKTETTELTSTSITQTATPTTITLTETTSLATTTTFSVPTKPIPTTGVITTTEETGITTTKPPVTTTSPSPPPPFPATLLGLAVIVVVVAIVVVIVVWRRKEREDPLMSP